MCLYRGNTPKSQMVTMKTHSFKRKSTDSLIVVPCYVGYDKLALALDTGASHTTIDLTPLLLDFFENIKFCIDMQQNIITTQK